LVTEGERTCKADLVNGVLHLQVPAQSPSIHVFARLEGNAQLPAPAAGWNRILHNDEDKFAVGVDVKSQR